jgi:hypothetical protein
MSPTSSRLKELAEEGTREKVTNCLLTGSLLSGLFDCEDVGEMFLRNVG